MPERVALGKKGCTLDVSTQKGCTLAKKGCNLGASCSDKKVATWVSGDELSASCSLDPGVSARVGTGRSTMRF